VFVLLLEAALHVAVEIDDEVFPSQLRVQEDATLSDGVDGYFARHRHVGIQRASSIRSRPTVSMRGVAVV
jgi:hypothetical protein